MLKRVFQRFWVDSDLFKALLVIVGGTVAWSLTMVKSGLIYPFGIGFWGPNGHDGVWHLALINSLARGSLSMPVFAGEAIKNYHLGFDLLVAFLHKISFIPVVSLYFQKLPPVLALLTGVLTYKFVLDWKKSKKAAWWATFFVYFGGSLGWIVELIRGKGIGGESLFWSQQSISTLVNPPFAMSLVLILAGLIFLRKFLKEAGISNFILATVFLGVLIEIKVYAGVLVLAGLFVAGLKDRRIWKIFGSALVLSALMFFTFNRGSISLLVFRPLWFLETMMGLSDRLDWPRFYSAMTNYRLGQVWLKAVPAYLVAFVIFYIGNMGTRLVKEIQVWRWVKNIRSADFWDFFFAAVVIFGTLIPMIFLQAGTPWNTIQFFYYSLFAASILAGVAFGEFLISARLSTAFKYLLEVMFVLLTLPTTIGTLKDVYLPARPPAKLSNQELTALSFLSAQKPGVVLTYPFDKEAAKAAEPFPPRPLYLYESTAYVSAFSQMPVFLEDEVNLDITGYDWRLRRREVLDFLATTNQSQAQDFLRGNKISYIYWLKGQRATLGETQLGLKEIFANSEVKIYLVE